MGVCLRGVRADKKHQHHINYKHAHHRKITGSVSERLIIVFVLAMEESHSGSVTPKFAKLRE